MDNEVRASDIRVPLALTVFSLSVVAGGIFLVLYVFYPAEARPWYPIASFLLIGSPWIFWLLTFIYASCIIKRLLLAPATENERQISRRPTTRNASSVTSSKEPEMPLTTQSSV